MRHSRDGDKIIAAFLIDKDLGSTQRVEPTEGAGIKFPKNNYEALVFYRDSRDLHGSVGNFFVAFWGK